MEIDLVEDSSIPTLCTNGVTLKFNPAHIAEESNLELIFDVAHEIGGHCAGLDHVRMQGREPGLWNQACDYVVNAMLIAEGFTAPKNILLDARFDGMSKERVYEILKAERDAKREQEKQDSEQGETESDQDSSGSDDSGDSQPGNDSAGNDQESDTGEESQSGGQGSEDYKNASTGYFEAPASEDSADLESQENVWRENVAQAIRAASSAGTLPGSIRKAMESTLAPKADPESLLRRFMSDPAKKRPDWSRRNKRFSEIYLPGKRNDGLGTVAFLVDTSGSIFENPQALATFQGMFNAVIQDVEPAQIIVVYCDSAVNRVDTFEQGEMITLAPCGGGGTAFQPAFDYLAENDIQPTCAIYLTDTYGDNPTEPEYPVLWCTYEANGRVMPFGETVPID